MKISSFTSLLNLVSLCKILCIIVITRKKNTIYAANIFGINESMIITTEIFYFHIDYLSWLSNITKIDCQPACCQPVLYINNQRIWVMHIDELPFWRFTLHCTSDLQLIQNQIQGGKLDLEEENICKRKQTLGYRVYSEG